VAEKRLAAIEEFTELARASKSPCATWRSAAWGQHPGPQQHGNVAAVGFDMYCHLLNEAVAKLKGGELPRNGPPPCNLDLDAYLRAPISPMSGQSWIGTSGWPTWRACELVHWKRGAQGPLRRSPCRSAEPAGWSASGLGPGTGLSEVTQKGAQVILRFYEDRMPGQEL